MYIYKYIVVEGFKLERQLELYYYLGLCHW